MSFWRRNPNSLNFGIYGIIELLIQISILCNAYFSPHETSCSQRKITSSGLLTARKVAGSATYKQSRIVWNYVSVCLFSLFRHEKIQTFSPKWHSLPQRSHFFKYQTDALKVKGSVSDMLQQPVISVPSRLRVVILFNAFSVYSPPPLKTRLEKPALASIKWPQSESLLILCVPHTVSTCHLPGMLLWKTDTRATVQAASPEDSHSPLTRISLIMFLHQAKHELPWRNAGQWRYGFSVIVWGLAPILYSINLSTSVALKIDADRGL